MKRTTEITRRIIEYDRSGMSDEELLMLWERMLLPRLIEEQMLLELRRGNISKWFSGIGQEAIAVGVASAMLPEEKIFTMHRNLGVFTTRGVPLVRLFAQWLGKEQGFTKGRDRSFHFGTLEYHIIGMISHLGAQLSVADGVALAYRLSDKGMAVAAFTGEGGTSEGEFHEALNTAAVWELPVLFVIENNGYGLSTPVAQQYKCAKLSDRAVGYGIEGRTIDGNNVIEVYKAVKAIVTQMRIQPAPFLLECMTFRMRGHEEASGTKYVPAQLMEYWRKRDPLLNYEQYLIEEGLLTEEHIEERRQAYRQEIKRAWSEALALPEVHPDPERERSDVYAPFDFRPVQPPHTTRHIRFVEAIREALDQAMQRHNKLVLMGQDIAEYGGVFKVTEGLLEKYGPERVRNTPLCESAILGIALGLAIEGYKSMVEMQFSDFVSVGFNQIVNNLAKSYYRWGQPQTNEAWFAKVHGLKIAYPSTPADAKGLLLTAFEDPNPVMFFEHKGLYRSVRGEVPEGY